MLHRLTEWLEDLRKSAEEDEQFSISWFGDTKDKPFSIIGGWLDGFSEEYSDILHISKSNPSYAMCVKIAINEGPYAYTDFELMDMPIDPATEEVDDTCIALEKDEELAELAMFFAAEWDRIMKEYGDAEE
jgi:hypothetical protein